MYLVKLSVVPDSSDRKKTWIASLGNVAFRVQATIAGSVQVLITARKIFAVTSGVEHEPLHAVDVVGDGDRPVTIGMFRRRPDARALAAATSPLSALRAESDPRTARDRR